MFEPDSHNNTSAASTNLRRPSAPHLAPPSFYGIDDIDDREATELQRVRTNYSRATASYRPGRTSTARRKATSGLASLTYPVTTFWKHHVCIVVDHASCRDHLALERTFLSYLRTSLAISMIGVTVAQLFRLQHAPDPNSVFGFYVLGKPLAMICQLAAIYSLLLGLYRSWRFQNAIVRGKAIVGGFEVTVLGIGVVVVCFMFFVLLVAVDIDKEDIL